jgi:hypothetical protein
MRPGVCDLEIILDNWYFAAARITVAEDGSVDPPTLVVVLEADPDRAAERSADPMDGFLDLRGVPGYRTGGGVRRGEAPAPPGD